MKRVRQAEPVTTAETRLKRISQGQVSGTDPGRSKSSLESRVSLRVAGTERMPEVKQGRAAGGRGGGAAKSRILAAPKPQVSLVSAGNGKLTNGFSQWGAQSDSSPSKRSFWLLWDERGGQDSKNGVRTCIGGSCHHLTHTETHAQSLLCCVCNKIKPYCTNSLTTNRN